MSSARFSCVSPKLFRTVRTTCPKASFCAGSGVRFFKHGNLSPIVFYKGRLFQLLCPVHAWHMQIGEICRIFLGYLRENTLISTCIRYLFVTAV